MGVGSSSGAYYPNEQAWSMAPYLKGNDNMVMNPDIEGGAGDDSMEKKDKGTPAEVIQASQKGYGEQGFEQLKPDYDYDSWKKANPDVKMEPGQHYPDTYKLPNHMTFSDESMYHGGENKGGHWGTDEQGRDTFTPGPTNLEHHSMGELRDYFKRVEPNAVLNPPDINDVPHHDWVENIFSGINNAVQTIHDIGSGKTGMWAMDQQTGEFHTSPEGMEKARSLIPLVMSGAIPTTIHLRGEGAELLGSHEAEARDQFQQLLARTRRQPSTTVERPPEPPAPPASPSGPDWPGIRRRLLEGNETDADVDHWLYHPENPYNQQIIHHTPADRAAVDSGRIADRLSQGSQQQSVSDIEKVSPKIRDKVEEATKEGSLKLIKDEDASRGTKQKFIFASKDGIGQLHLTERQNGKQLYVNWIGKGMNEDSYTSYKEGPNSFGFKDIKSLLSQIKEEFPNAETIKGFRVSGVRAHAGGGSENAEMRLRPAAKQPERKSIEQLNAEWNESQP